MHAMTTRRFRTSCAVACSLVTWLAGCGSTSEPPAPAPSHAPAAKNVAEGAGFVHTANNSRFRVGANPTSKLEYGISKLVGSEGVFGTVPETGWVLATPNARAPSTLAEPLTRSPDVHNKTVLDYFVGAGLPADQIGLVNAHATVKGSGVGSVDMSNGEFAGYTSVLSRTVAGIPVPDSFAWVKAGFAY